MTILTLAALLPPLYLMMQIYRADRVEQEPVRLIIKTILFGVISVFPTMFVESLLIRTLGSALPEGSVIYRLAENFIGVAMVEEFFKMMAVRLSVWRREEFDYTFDGVVYGVSAAIGFAAFENLLYVYDGGLVTAGFRAITAIPGHTIFGIFMGMHLGIAKYKQVRGDSQAASYHKLMAWLIPTLLHGFYDFICSSNSYIGMIIFILFLVFLYTFSIKRVRLFQQGDREI